MFELLITVVSCILTALLTTVLLALYLRRTVPIILGEVGESIGEQFSEIFEKPTVKQAMSLMGKKSGDVRATAALRNKAADKILDGIPSIGFVLDQLDLTPTEGLQLLNDPLVGPFIKGMIQKGMQGIGKNFSSPNNPGDGEM